MAHDQTALVNPVSQPPEALGRATGCAYSQERACEGASSDFHYEGRPSGTIQRQQTRGHWMKIDCSNRSTGSV
jgi:hypothetical protein